MKKADSCHVTSFSHIPTTYRYFEEVDNNIQQICRKITNKTWSGLKQQMNRKIKAISETHQFNTNIIHCVKIVRIRNFSDRYSVRMWENTGRKNPKYGHSSRSDHHLETS